MDSYWVNKPSEEMGKEIEARFDAYVKWLADTGYGDRIRAVYDAFYGMNRDGTLGVERDENDIAKINVNHLKSLVRRIHILVTENKLAFKPRSKNSDSKSAVESDLARGICEYYNDEKAMNEILSEAVLGALVMLEYYVHCPWSYEEGFELAADGGRVIRSGDQRFATVSPFDLARSGTGKESQWFIVREKRNKFDLAEQYPEFAPEIIASKLERDENDPSKSLHSDDDEDYIHLMTMYHMRTPAVPEGRQTVVAASKTLEDGPLAYDKMPIFKITAGEIIQTLFGDSPAVDLMPLQEALNAVFSGIVNNNLNNSIQLIWSPDPNMRVEKISTGQSMVISAAPPQGINLTNSGTESYKMIELLKADQQLISGVSDVARGNPSSNLKSGTSLAIILAQAIQYVSHLQKSYARLAGDVATQLVSNIKKFSPEEMTAYIVGSSKKGQIRKFRAEDLMDVERIAVDLGNPLIQTYAGRQELMQTWQQYGVVKNPKQIINFLTTGNLDAEIEDEFSDAILIQSENEMLRKGERPVALITDNHPEHIQKHNKLFSDPLERENPDLTALAFDHMMEHIDLMKKMPMDLAAILAGQPLPPPPPPGPPPGETPNPTLETARLPDVPNGTPPEMADGYNEMLAEMPPDQATQTL